MDPIRLQAILARHLRTPEVDEVMADPDLSPPPEGYTPIVTIHLPMDMDAFLSIQRAVEGHFPGAVIRAGPDPHLMTIYDKPDEAKEDQP